MKKLIITAALYESNISASGKDCISDAEAEIRAIRGDDANACRSAADRYKTIRDAASELCGAGVSMIHLYVDPEGNERNADGGIFIKRLTESIYEQCPEVLIVPELLSRNKYNRKSAFEMIKNEPELAVLNCDIDNASEDADHAEEQIRSLGNAMLDNGVRPLLKCTDKGMVDTAIRLYREGWISDPLLFLFILGTKGGMDASIDNLLYLKNSIPANSSWSVGCCGDDYLDMAAAAMLMGGNISIGDDKCGTSELIGRIRKTAQLAELMGRKTASPAEARAIMNLNIKYRRIIDEHLL